MCWLRQARDRARVRARARIMVARYGGPAYWLARDRFWGKVAVEIARLDGRVIGLGTGERWR